MIRVTRRYNFSASHRLHAAGLSDAENREVYGKCDNPYGHGHNYEIEVSARGPIQERSGHAMNRSVLDRLVQEQVLRPFDHQNLNGEKTFEAAVPTTENLGSEIFRRLETNWNRFFTGDWPRLEKVRILETRNNIFEVSKAHAEK